MKYVYVCLPYWTDKYGMLHMCSIEVWQASKVWFGLLAFQNYSPIWLVKIIQLVLEIEVEIYLWAAWPTLDVVVGLDHRAKLWVCGHRYISVLKLLKLQNLSWRQNTCMKFKYKCTHILCWTFDANFKDIGPGGVGSGSAHNFTN